MSKFRLFLPFWHASSFSKLLSFCSVLQNNQTTKRCTFWSRAVWTFENPQKKGRSVVLAFLRIALSFERNREAVGGQSEGCSVCVRIMRLWMEASSELVMIRYGEGRCVHLKKKKSAESIILYLIIRIQFIHVQGVLRNPRGLSICSLGETFQ